MDVVLRALPSVPVALILALGACEPTPAVEDSRQEVIGGSIVALADYPTLGALVALSPNGMGSLCTATLIGADLLLTAAHCVHPDLLVDDEGEPLADVTFSFIRRVNVRGTLPEDEFIPVTDTVFHPDFDIPCLSAGDQAVCNDIALAVLGEPQDPPYQQLASAERGAALEVGAAAEVVGYGLSNRDNENSNGVLRRGEVTLDEVTPFDIAAGRSDEQSVCYGDSGGPLLVVEGTQFEQIGVTSRGYSDNGICRGGLFSRVDPYVPWIIETAAALGASYNEPADALPSEDDTGKKRKGGGCNSAPELGVLVAALILWAVRPRRAYGPSGGEIVTRP